MTEESRPTGTAVREAHNGELESLKTELASHSLLLKACTTALFLLDKSGLIRFVNQSAVTLLDADEAYLLNKPFSLFVAPDDQATFFINRSRIAAGAQSEPFEINLRKTQGDFRIVRINARTIDSPGQQLPEMLLAADDVTAYRQVLEQLQFKTDLTHLLFSTLDDLAAWPATDLDEIIHYSLEKIGMVTRADRIYICLFHEQKSRLSISHQWSGEGIVSPALQNTPVGAYIQILRKLKNQAAACVTDIHALPPEARSIHARFHAEGVKSFLFVPLLYGRNLLGMIGCDAVRRHINWSSDTHQLVRSIGSAIVHALVRRQTETAPTDVRQSILQLIEPASSAVDDWVQEYDGPIDIADDATATPDASDTDWRFEKAPANAPQPVDIIFLKDGKTASLACNHCYRQRKLDISEIRVLGTRLKATCACGKVKTIKVELRREHRKAVNLRGIFMRGPGDRPALKSDDWGHIEVGNLSRRGIGFKVLGKADIRVNDRLCVKFTLDNTAESIIQKTVVVRSVTAGMIGCEFDGRDACDVTLGFYMMN